MMKSGFIYIMTNPSFPDYVKIGYAKDVSKRLAQLNRSECIPFAFRVYALYEVDQVLQDKQLHRLIDTLNPELRAIDRFDNKERVREFYAISPEEAYALLECIAKISGTIDRLKRTTETGDEIKDREIAESVAEESRARREAFNFAKCGIEPGSKIQFVNDKNIFATVLDERMIEFNDKRTSLSRAAMEILNTNHSLQGTLYWEYDGKVLNDLRLEREEQGSYEI